MTVQFKQANRANYGTGRSQGIKYIVIHYTAGNGDKAQGNATYFAREAPKSSAHYFVDEREAWQSVRDADTAWHCGVSGGYKQLHPFCRNANSIGIEMCSVKDGTGTYSIRSETAARAAALAKELMAKYGVPAENVIRHYDVTGKHCPEPFVRDPAQWDAFKKSLA
jgi:N-acetylmuramoyl-L-alanine amidase